MTLKILKEKWPMYLIMIVANILLLFLTSCPPTTESLVHNGKKVTRPELQLELNIIMTTAEYRIADLDQKQKFRDFVLKNALVMIEQGAFNPLGMATALFAFYGIGTAANAGLKKLKKKTDA